MESLHALVQFTAISRRMKDALSHENFYSFFQAESCNKRLGDYLLISLKEKVRPRAQEVSCSRCYQKRTEPRVEVELLSGTVNWII